MRARGKKARYAKCDGRSGGGKGRPGRQVEGTAGMGVSLPETWQSPSQPMTSWERREGDELGGPDAAGNRLDAWAGTEDELERQLDP